MSDYRLRLDAESLASKFGFDDGDLPEGLLDEYTRRGLPYPDDWHPALRRLVREYLLPALSRLIEVYDIQTSHNPIRAVDPDEALGLEGVVSVEVTFEQIQAAITGDSTPEVIKATAENDQQPWCDWCGRAIEQQDGRWIAVKGVERGYDPVACEANTDDGTHDPAGRPS